MPAFWRNSAGRCVTGCDNIGTRCDSGQGADIRELLTFHRISQTLYRYASCIDRQDFRTLRGLFADDATVAFGDLPPVTGADAIVSWIADTTRERAWQHHSIAVYHIELFGDRADALSYLTSLQFTKDDPQSAIVNVGRYYDELRCDRADWQIVSKKMEIGWRETRHRAAS
jgi:3-phenylpropionate/cinnamic acid dioxygenase small subunit